MNAAGKSLIILTPGFPEDENDSACLPWMQNIVRAFQKEISPVNVVILAFQYPHKKEPYLWEGIRVIPFGGANKGGISKLFLRYKINRTLTKIHRQEKVAGILSFWYGECARTGHLFAQKAHIKHFCWIAGQDAKKENKLPGTIRIDGANLITASDFLQEYFEQNHKMRPAHVIPFGLDTKQFPDNIPEKDIDLLAAGSLIPLKQYEIFVETVKAVHEKIPEIKAVLVGKGPEERKLRQQIKEYRLESVITLTGELPYTEVLKYMQRAKIFLHPSSYEGFGCSCNEALYAGALVIRFTKPMKREIRNTIVVQTKEEMITKTTEQLQLYKEYKSVNEFPAEKTVRDLAALFGL